MQYYILTFFFIPILTFGQNRDNSVKLLDYVKKFNLSIEGGYFKQEYYYRGDLNIINPFPYPIIIPYPKIRLGYEISPKLSIEYAFTTFKYLAFRGFVNSFTFLTFEDASVEFQSYTHELGVRYYFKSFSNERKSWFLSWNPSLVFESFDDNTAARGYSSSMQYKDTSRTYQLALSNFYIRNELFIELYSKRNKTSWGLGIAYKFNPLFKTILSTDITYESEGKKRYANSASNGSGLTFIFLRYTFYLKVKKPIKRHDFFN